MAKRAGADVVVEECVQALGRPVREFGGLAFRPLLFGEQRALERGLQELLGEEAFLLTMPLSFTVRLQQAQGGVVMDEALLRARALALLRAHGERVLALLCAHTGHSVEQLSQLTAGELYEAIQHILEVRPLEC